MRVNCVLIAILRTVSVGFRVELLVDSETANVGMRTNALDLGHILHDLLNTRASCSRHLSFSPFEGHAKLQQILPGKGYNQ